VNKLIVESQNDKYFIQRVLEHLELTNVEISNPICNVDEYICLDGIDNLKRKLQDMKLDDIDSLGIVLDADDAGVEKRVEQINKIFKELDINIVFEKANEFKYDAKFDIKIACHILNIGGSGDLDTVLKQIAKNSSIFADCLNGWRKCLQENNKEVTDKAFLKFWVNNYLRFDTCTQDEQKQSFKKCNFEQALKKDVWDFEHKVLDDMKDFLKLFNNEVKR